MRVPGEEGTNPLFKQKEISCGTKHQNHPKTVFVVAVVWRVVVTIGGASVVLIVVERPAAHDAPVVRQPRAWCMSIVFSILTWPMLATICNAIGPIVLQQPKIAPAVRPALRAGAGLRYRYARQKQ